MDVKLKNEEGGTIKTTIYVVEGERESLLGRDDAIALGIIGMKPRGKADCGQTINLKRLTEEKPNPKVESETDSRRQTRIDTERKTTEEENGAAIQTRR